MDVKVINWAEKEKVQMFDKIAEMYFNKKFGTFSEADSDLLLFNFYSEKKIRENSDSDDVLNYSPVRIIRLQKNSESRCKRLEI